MGLAAGSGVGRGHVSSIVPKPRVAEVFHSATAPQISMSVRLPLFEFEVSKLALVDVGEIEEAI